MIEDREKEWQNLRRIAEQMLDDPRLLPKDIRLKHFDQTLHLWISPTFTPEKHWVFNKPQQQINPQPKPIVQQFIWQKDLDFQRLNDPLIGLQKGFDIEPTFETKMIEIEREAFQKFHTKLAKIQIPPFLREEFLGRDGEHFGVQTLGSYHSAKIIWWSSYPEEWQELIDWYENVKEFLEEKLNDL